MRLLVLSVFLMGLIGCSTTLRPDPSALSAIDAGYPTVEIHACDRIFNGVGICPVNIGDDLSVVTINIQGYFQGTLTANSESCGVNINRRYKDNALIPIRLSGKASQSCVLDFVLSPEYPDEQDTGIQVFPLKGRLYIRALNAGDAYLGQSQKVQEGRDPSLKIPIEVGGEYRVVFRGCGTSFDKKIRTNELFLSVPLSEITEITKKSCIFNGAVIRDNEVLRVTWQVFIYDERFSQIPIPEYSISGRDILVTADTAVGIIAVEGEVKFSNEAKLPFAPHLPQKMRLLTVKGRNIIGQWDYTKGSWEWYK